MNHNLLKSLNSFSVRQLGSQQRMKSGTAAEKAAPTHKTAQEKDDFKG
jgi:hypothetical protein